MDSSLVVTEVRFTPAPSWWQDKGLLGWASCVVDNDLGVGGMGVRRRQDGRLTLSFPRCTVANGRVHHHAPRALEAQVIGELRGQGVLP